MKLIIRKETGLVSWWRYVYANDHWSYVVYTTPREVWFDEIIPWLRSCCVTPNH